MLLSNLEVARSHMLANFFEMEPYSLSASLFCPLFSVNPSLPYFVTKNDDLWTHSVHSSKSYSVLCLNQRGDRLVCDFGLLSKVGNAILRPLLLRTQPKEGWGRKSEEKELCAVYDCILDV